MGKTVLAFLLLLLTFNTAMAEDKAPVEAGPLFQIAGQYAAITPPQPTEDPATVEVVELFWYGCPHCYHFEPYLEKWRESMPEYAVFRRMPAVFRKEWIPHAQAYYAAEALGVLDKIHGPLFGALHKDKRKIFSRAEIADFFAEQGVEREAFNKTYDSFAVKSKVKQAIIMTQRYGITGVPSLVINGKYRTSGSIADGFDGMLKVTNVLIEEEKGNIRTQRAENGSDRAIN